MKTTKIQLKNGLPVFLTPSHKAPVVSVQMWVRTGSADEKKGEEGISHFIEHLVFKGTRKFKVGEIAATIEGSGGELNAYTSFDQTVFHVTISRQFLETGLSAIAEMMGFPTFDPQEIDNERGVVIEEIKRGQDSLGRAASELLFANNYKSHAYGLPVIGYTRNIEKFSAKKISDYFHSRYTPRNMFLVVSGDFEVPEMKKQIQTHFGEFVDYPVRKVVRKREPKQTKPRVKIAKTNFEQSLAYVSFKAPKVAHRDVPALDVLAMILGQGESSRLVQKMRIQEAIVNSVGASTYTPQDEGLIMVSMGYNPDKLKPAFAAILETLAQIRTTPVTAAELQRTIVNFSSEEFYGLETVDGIARKVGSLEFYYRDQAANEKYLRAVRSLKPADLLRVARQYLKPETLCLSIATNDHTRRPADLAKAFVKDWTKIVRAEARTLKIPAEAKKAVRHTPMTFGKAKVTTTETRKIVLPNGLTFLLRPHQDTHVISAKVAMLGGQRLGFAGGSVELLSRTLTCGTKQRNEQAIAEESEAIAAGLSPVAGRNSVGLGLDVLTAFQNQGLDLFLDVLMNPQFPFAAVEREKLVQLEQIRTRADNPAQTCGRQFMQRMFSGHPYADDMMGTPESLSHVGPEMLLDLWRQQLTSHNTTVAICGNFDVSAWQAEIQDRLQSLPKGKKLLAALPISPLQKDDIVFSASQKEQSHLMIGFRGPQLGATERYALQIIQSILAGQGGRLFLELRDKNSLAYSVSPMRMEGVETGYFGAYIGCSPEKVEKALKMLRHEFQRLTEEKVSALELERAQRYLIGRHDIDLQRTSAIGASILYNDIYGIDYNEAFTSAEYYFAVTPEQILKMSQRLFSQPAVISLVGPKNPLS